MASFHRFMVTCVNGGLWQNSTIKGSQLFTANGTFYPPQGVTTVYVLLIEGGGGGTCGNFGGGSGGYVSCGSVDVSGMININIIVGIGGAPSDTNAELFGGSSSFGSQITASGGKTASNSGGLNHNGANGGTGSGYSTLVQT